MKSLESLQKTIHYQFNDQQLLMTAVTHRSYSRNNNNERLEFIGDSVLGLVITEHLYQRKEDANEGDLSRIRSSLVREDALASVARDIRLGDYLRLGSGELKSGGYRRNSTISDALEALFGAVFLDSDYQRCKQVILFLYQDYLVTLPKSVNLKDPKTTLQEYLQSQKIDLPVYQVVAAEGKSHDQVFTVNCEIADLELVTSGRGSSRKKAEQMAAAAALKQAQNG